MFESVVPNLKRHHCKQNTSLYNSGLSSAQAYLCVGRALKVQELKKKRSTNHRLCESSFFFNHYNQLLVWESNIKWRQWNRWIGNYVFEKTHWIARLQRAVHYCRLTFWPSQFPHTLSAPHNGRDEHHRANLFLLVNHCTCVARTPEAPLCSAALEIHAGSIF